MEYSKPSGKPTEILQGDRAIVKLVGVKAIVLAKDPNKEGRFIMFSLDTKEKFICNGSLLMFVSRGRIPRNSGPKLDTTRPVYPSSFRTVHEFDQVIIHETHKIALIKGFDKPVKGLVSNMVEITDIDANSSKISVHGISLISRDDTLAQVLKEVKVE